MRTKSNLTIYEQIKITCQEIVNKKGSSVLIKQKVIRTLLKDTFHTNPNSVILSDYCYNRTNNGIKFNDEKCLFEYKGRNMYKFLGEQYLFTGELKHKPKGLKEELVVGYWINGIYKNKTEEYIKERQREFAKNIDEFPIGQIVLDSDGAKCEIVGKTSNSIEVRINRKKDTGIDCTQWFDMNNFNKRFKR